MLVCGLPQLRLNRPLGILLSEALTFVSIPWVFIATIFYFEFWITTYYFFEEFSPDVTYLYEPRFLYDGLILLLTLALAIGALAALRTKSDRWAGRLQLACVPLLGGHSALWMTTLGKYQGVQEIAWLVYLRYDFPPEIMLALGGILALFQTSLQGKIRGLFGRKLPLPKPREVGVRC